MSVAAYVGFLISDQRHNSAMCHYESSPHALTVDSMPDHRTCDNSVKCRYGSCPHVACLHFHLTSVIITRTAVRRLR